MDKRNLEVLLCSHFPIIAIDTHEETHAVDLVKHSASTDGRRVVLWSIATGLHDVFGKPDYRFSTQKLALEGEKQEYGDTYDPEKMLEAVKANVKKHVVIFLDFHPYLTNPRIVRLVKEIAQNKPMLENSLVFISHEITIPPELSRLSTKFSISLPTLTDLEGIVKDEAKVWQLKNKQQKLVVDKKAVGLLVKNMMGLTRSDARQLARNAIVDDGAITHSDVTEVMEAKYKLVNQDGLLSFEYDTANFSEVGGFSHLKIWLDKRKNYFISGKQDIQVDLPKGILLVGVQGCGKSLAAKAVAGVWGVPLLRLDFGVLYNKYIGETEKNIREAIKTAEMLQPCVLWIDEIEKGIETSTEDNGISQRVLGTLLTWMAEKKSRVFVVATANNISVLPPELIRKGRMDEIFFVDLPDENTRSIIFKLHLGKRNIDAASIDVALLSRECDGFSGAEIEQVIVSAMYSVGHNHKGLSTQDLIEEVQQTRPLSVVMREQMQSLRTWANGRTVLV